MDSVLSANHDCRVRPADPFYVARRQRKEAALDNLTDDVDYRALGELRVLFSTARTLIEEYFIREVARLAQPTAENRAPFVSATRAIARLHANAGLHEPFVTKVYGLADIPLDARTDEDGMDPIAHSL